jgi:hypothetical protein
VVKRPSTTRLEVDVPVDLGPQIDRSRSEEVEPVRAYTVRDLDEALAFGWTDSVEGAAPALETRQRPPDLRQRRPRLAAAEGRGDLGL